METTKLIFVEFDFSLGYHQNISARLVVVMCFGPPQFSLIIALYMFKDSGDA